MMKFNTSHGYIEWQEYEDPANPYTLRIGNVIRSELAWTTIRYGGWETHHLPVNWEAAT